MVSVSNAVRRLSRDLQHLENNVNPQVKVAPSSRSMLEWHFVLHDLPESTPYAGGVYHGRLIFPESYPLAPPTLLMVTPSGRLQTNQRLCLSMTDFHPESWNPAWTVESLLVGVISFMVDEHDPTSFGSMHETTEVRRNLAAESLAFNLANAEFRELFPQFSQGRAGVPSTDGDGEPDARKEDEREEPKHVLTCSTLDTSGDGSAAAVASSSRASRDTEEAEVDVAAEGAPAALPQPLAPRPADARPTARDDLPDSIVPASTNDTHSESGRLECWICREDASLEPLIQPCACRGSMSGVHASCVESWIAHHRSNSRTDEVPRCSVCGEEYTGTERRPGVIAFAHHLCKDFLRQAFRTTFLVCLLVVYWTAAQPHAHLSTLVRVLLFALSGSAFLFKALVLGVSLPRGRLPPDNVLRRVFTADVRLITVLVAEMVAIVVIASLWCIYGHLHFLYVLPLFVITLLPLCSMLLRQQPSPCSQHALMMVAVVLMCPVICFLNLCSKIWKNPRMLVDPFDGVLHAFVSVALMPMCWLCESNLPPLCVWAAHSVVLALAILEKTQLKKAHWKEGRAWWTFLQLSVLTVYVANLLRAFDRGIWTEHSALLVCAVSLVWLALASTLTFMVNWNICVDQYRAWQHRNGQFSLSPSGTPQSTPTNRGRAQTIGAALWGGEAPVGGATAAAGATPPPSQQEHDLAFQPRIVEIV